jgi:ssDNA-binding replication factor A large subunit
MRVKIKDLRPHMENVEVVARVVNKSQVTQIRMKKYAYATIEDETGKIKLNLWRDQVEQVDVGDLIKVTNAFVYTRTGEKQLSTWSDIEKGSLKEFVQSL